MSSYRFSQLDLLFQNFQSVWLLDHLQGITKTTNCFVVDLDRNVFERETIVVYYFILARLC